MKKYFLFFTLLFQIVLQIKADDISSSAVYVWVAGSSTCYQLASMPTVTYKEDVAILTLNNSSTPELTLPLTDGATLEVTYGKYISENIKQIDADKNSIVKKVGKYIKGGKLVIIKEGKHFDINGLEIMN